MKSKSPPRRPTVERVEPTRRRWHSRSTSRSFSPTIQYRIARERFGGERDGKGDPRKFKNPSTAFHFTHRRLQRQEIAARPLPAARHGRKSSMRNCIWKDNPTLSGPEKSLRARARADLARHLVPKNQKNPAWKYVQALAAATSNNPPVTATEAGRLKAGLTFDTHVDETCHRKKCSMKSIALVDSRSHARVLMKGRRRLNSSNPKRRY